MNDDVARVVHNVFSGGVVNGPLIQAGVVNLQAPAPLTPAMTGLPPPSRAFTGREEHLRDLVANLGPDAGRSAPITVMSGQAGVGKTELALQVAHRALDTEGWFDGGVLFADLAGYAADPEHRMSPGDVLASFLRALAVGDIPDGRQDRARLYGSVLGTWADEGRRVLVVVDNASDSADVRPLIPADPRIPVLVTSRHQLSDIPNATIVDLPVLEPDESVEFLRRTLLQSRGSGDRRIDAEPDAADAVVRRCGHLPLALHIVAVRLADTPGRTLADLATALASAAHGPATAGGVLDQLQRGDIGVRAAFDLSYDALPEDQVALLAALPRALALTHETGTGSGHSVSTGALAAVADLAEPRAELLIEALARAHLVEPDAQYGWWRLHDLVGVYLGEKNARRPDPESEGARDRLRSHHLAGAREALTHLVRGARPAPRFADGHAAWVWLEHECAGVVDAVVAELSCPDGERYRRGLELAWDLGVYLFQEEAPGSARRLHAAVTLYEAVAGAARAGGDLPLVLMALSRNGDALTRLKTFDSAVRVRTRAQEIAVSAEPRIRLDTEAELADTLRLASRFPAALAAYRRALELAAQIGDRSREPGLLNGLAVALRATGEVAAALLTTEQAQTVARELDDRAGEARALATFGNIMRQAGRGDEALQAFGKASLARREAGDPFGEADVLMTMIEALRENGRPAEALVVCARTHQVLAGTDANPAREGALYALLGDVLRDLGRYREAVGVYREAGQRLPERLLDGDLTRAKTMAGYLDAVERHLERTSEQLVPDKALASLREFSRTVRDTVRENDTSLRKFADFPNGRRMFAERGYDRYSEMRFYHGDLAFQQAMLDEHRQSGDRYSEARVLGDIGRSLSDSGRLEEALTALTEAHNTLRDIGHARGELQILAHLGAVLRRQERVGEAAAVCLQLVDVARRLMRPDVEAFAWQLRSCDLLYVADGVEAAADCHERAFRYFLDHGDLRAASRALDEFTEGLCATGRPEEALAHLGRLLRTAQSSGNRTEEVLLLHRTGLALHDAGRYDEAVSAQALTARIAHRAGDEEIRWLAVRDLGRSRSSLARTRWRSRISYRRARALRAGPGLFGRYPVKSIRYTLHRRWHLLPLCAGALVVLNLWGNVVLGSLLGAVVGLADALLRRKDSTPWAREAGGFGARVLFGRVKRR
ncbi:NB-ARC domain-containing protein [Streptomyces parvus]|uniref:NB-ARC domain-containing protein n=1 Tax=Streptomyces parvus TaxID=66428 RepID=UPI003D75D1B2